MKNILKLMMMSGLVGLSVSSCVYGQNVPENKSGVLIGDSQVLKLNTAEMQGFYDLVFNEGTKLESAVVNYNKNNISSALGFGSLDSGAFIANNNRGVTGMQMYDIKYYTDGANANQDIKQNNRTVSGAVYVPLGADDKPLAIPKGVVLFFHPTTAIKNLVPSCYRDITSANIQPSYCNNGDPTALASVTASSIAYAGTAAIYTSQGYVVVMPDYVGQGIDATTVHPYVVYPEVNAADGINMLTATRTLLTQEGVAAANLNLFATGFSEGGAYALALAKVVTPQSSYASQLSASNYTLKMVSPAEGAYDLYNQMQFEFANLKDGILNTGGVVTPNMVDTSIPGKFDLVESLVSEVNQYKVVSALNATTSKPILSGYALVAFGYYDQHNLTTIYDTMMQHGFWSSYSIGGTNYSLPQLFASAQPFNFNGSIVAKALSMNNPDNSISYGNVTTANPLNLYLFNPVTEQNDNITTLSLDPNFSDPGKPVIYPARNNSVSAFIPSAIINNPLFLQVMADASLLNFKPSVKVNLISLAYDSTVPFINTQNAYAKLHAVAPTMVESVIIANAPITNNISPLLSAYFTAGFTGSAVSKFMTSDAFSRGVSTLTGISVSSPIDHPSDNIFSIAMLPSLCAFEHYESAQWGSNMTGNCVVQ